MPFAFSTGLFAGLVALALLAGPGGVAVVPAFVPALSANSLSLSLRLQGWTKTSILIAMRLQNLWSWLLWLCVHLRKSTLCPKVLLSIALWVSKNVRGFVALRPVDDQTTLVHSHLLVLSYLSKLLVILILSSFHLSELLVSLLVKLTMLRGRGWLFLKIGRASCRERVF